MVNNCNITKMVKNVAGEDVVSSLFTELTRVYGLKGAINIYDKIKGMAPSVDTVEYDSEDGEPILSSVIFNNSISKVMAIAGVPVSKYIKQIQVDAGMDNLVFDSPAGVMPIVNKYNKENPDSQFIAIWEKKGNKYIAKVVRKTEDSLVTADIQKRNTDLNDIAKPIFDNFGLTGSQINVAQHALEGTIDKDGIEISEARSLQALLESIAAVIDYKTIGTTIRDIPKESAVLFREIAKTNESGLQNWYYRTIKVLSNPFNVKIAEQFAIDPNILEAGLDKNVAEKIVDDIIYQFVIKGMSTDSIDYMPVTIENFIKYFNEWFNGKDSTDISKALKLAATKSGVTYESLFEEATIEPDSDNTFANNLSNMLEQLIQDDIQRLAVLQKKFYTDVNGKTVINKEEKNRISELRNNIIINEQIAGISNIAKQTSGTIYHIQEELRKLEKMRSEGKDVQNKIMKVLRMMRTNIDAYNNMLTHVDESILEHCTGDKERSALLALREMRKDIDNLQKVYDEKFRENVKKSFEAVLGPSITWKSGEHKGQISTIDQIMNIAANDISWFDYMMDSMGESSNPLLVSIDQLNKKIKDKTRNQSIDAIHRLQNLGLRMEKDGIKGTEWMYEKDENGKYTLSFKTEIDWSAFKKDKYEFYQELKRKYSGTLSYRQKKARKQEITDWENEHCSIDTLTQEKKPKLSMYRSKQYSALSNLQKKYLAEFMEIKHEADAFYGPRVSANRVPIIHKSTIERLADARHDATKTWDIISQGFQDLYKAREYELGNEHLDSREMYDETGLVDEETIDTLLDFNNKQIYSVPMYFTAKPKDFDVTDLSTDAISSMAAYYYKAAEYKNTCDNISEIEADIEWVQTKLGVEQRLGGKLIQNKASVMGEDIVKPATVYGTHRIAQKLDDWKMMQLYGQMEKNEGNIGKASVAKLADTANWFTSLHSLAFNLLAGTSNIATGGVMMSAEAFCGEYYSFGDLRYAASTFFGNVLEAAGNCGKRVKSDKLSLWMEKFNVLQDFEAHAREVDWKAKTRVGKFGLGSVLFFMNNLGEYYMQNQTVLAMANRVKLKDKSGKEYNLWDAYEVKYKTDTPGKYSKTDQGLGADLVLRPGLKDANGESWTEEKMNAFINKSGAVNRRMHGIYNRTDRANMQHYAIGRMAIMFRKWIKVSMNKRFAESQYNADLGQETEGYYRTCGRLMKQLCKEIRAGEFKLSSFNVSPTEKANLKRALFETLTFLTVAVLANGIEWPDDKDKNWLQSMTEYQCRRLYNELGALTPSPVMAKEMYTILKSPTADLSVMQKFLNLFQLFSPSGWTEEINTGIHKGRIKNVQKVIDIFPFIKPIEANMDPRTKLDAFRSTTL